MAKTKKPIDYTKRSMAFLRSHLRRMWLYYSESRKLALDEVRSFGKVRGRKQAVYLCYSCEKKHPLKEVQVDHIIKLGELNYGNLGEWVTNLMHGEQVTMCKPCHNFKGKLDNNKRKKHD